MKIRKLTENIFVFRCPGCKCNHIFDIRVWQFNGDFKNPTVSPSILVNGDARYFNPTMPRCHSFVREGRIRFLSDCTHALAGQTIDIPEWEELDRW